MQTFHLNADDPAIRHAPSEEDVRSELERILTSPRLQASDRRRAFLRFIVEETLAGRATRLKGYTIAVAVFGRDETFDPQADPVVRLEARRLRRDLNSYYVDAGSHDALRISIPKGSYIPHFEWHEGAQSAAESGDAPGAYAPEHSAHSNGVSGEFHAGRKPGHFATRKLMIVALLVAVSAIAAASWVLAPGNKPTISGADGPAIVILPFDALSANEDSRYLASGISQELVGNLLGFPGFRLYNLPTGFTKDADAEPASLGRELGVTYVISGSVRAEAAEVRVATQVFDARTGEVLWARTYDRPLTAKALIRVQRDLAGEIAIAVGQPYGIVNNDLRGRLATPSVSSMESYVCVLRGYDYRRGFAREKFEPALRCLQEAVQRDPDYSDAWAMLGWLHLDAGRIGYADVGTSQAEYEKAFEAASRAVALAPDSILALKALAAVNHYIGRYDESERMARRALELNPRDPETLAQLGWRLAVRGKFEEGIAFLKRAIDRSLNPPGWYYHLIAIDLYLKGDYEEMLRVARRSVEGGRGVSQLLIAVAAGELGDHELARQALKKMSEYKSFASDPAGYIRRHGATEEIVAALMAGLRKARRIEQGS